MNTAKALLQDAESPTEEFQQLSREILDIAARFIAKGGEGFSKSDLARAKLQGKPADLLVREELRAMIAPRHARMQELMRRRGSRSTD